MAYIKEKWKNVTDPSNPGTGAVPISAEIMDKIEQGIVDANTQIDTNNKQINGKVDLLESDIINKIESLGFKLTAEFKTAGTYTWTPTKSQCTAIAIVIAAGDGGDGGVSQSSLNYSARPGSGGCGGAAIVSSILTLEAGVSIPIVVGAGGNGGVGKLTASSNLPSAAGSIGGSSSCLGLVAQSSSTSTPCFGTLYPPPYGNTKSVGCNPFSYPILPLSVGGAGGGRVLVLKGGSYSQTDAPNNILQSFLGSGVEGGSMRLMAGDLAQIHAQR